MASDAMPKGGYKLLTGSAPKTDRERPALSCIEVAEYVPLPDEVRNAVTPSPQTMNERREARHRFLVEQTLTKRREVERLLGKTFGDEAENRKRLSAARRTAKQAMIARPPLDPLSVPALLNCRFRNITILECLTKVCVDQKEFIPVANWSASVAEPLTVSSAQQPAFTITDCVNDMNHYTASEGWISVSATLRMTQAVYVNEVGVNFAGTAFYDVDGEDHTFWGNEWGAISIGSSLEVRSSPPGGAFVNLVGPASWSFEVIAENDEGPVAPMPFMPANRSVAVNQNVDVGHTFIIDYTLSWDVTRSDDYNSGSCFGLSNFVFKPYIIYKSCHSEWREVSRFYPQLMKIIQQLPSPMERAG